MKKKFFSHLVKSVFLLVGMLVLTTSTISAHSINSQSTASKSSQCNILLVSLHGSSPATFQCQAVAQAALSPAAEGHICGSNTSDLALYWNSPIGVSPNYLLCINGFGVLSLNQTFPDGRNWNRQASAWWTGCADVLFYGYAGGVAFAYGSSYGLNSPSGIFPYSSENTLHQGVGTVYNDDLIRVILEAHSGNGC